MMIIQGNSGEQKNRTSGSHNFYQTAWIRAHIVPVMMLKNVHPVTLISLRHSLNFRYNRFTVNVEENENTSDMAMSTAGLKEVVTEHCAGMWDQ